MNKKHRRTLEAVFDDPVRANIAWRDIEDMLEAAGAELSEGEGSRVRIALNGVRAVFHRPHPQKETRGRPLNAPVPDGSWSNAMMEYKGYMGKVEFDDEAAIFHGEVIHTRDVITFQGESVPELKQAFQTSVDDYLAFCAERGEEPEKPFSGQFVTRIPPELHRKVNLAASMSGKSLNAWVAEQLQSAVARARVIKGRKIARKAKRTGKTATKRAAARRRLPADKHA